MDCKYLETRLCDYIDGTLSDQELAAVNKHRAACPSCEVKVSQTAALVTRLTDLSSAPAPAYLNNLVLSEVARRYRQSLGDRLQSFYADLTHPLRMIEGRDIMIALVSLPIALSFFLAIFFHIQYSILNAEQVTLLTYTSHESPLPSSFMVAASESESDSLMPVGISSPSLVRFVESASETRNLEDYFLVMVYVTQEGAGSIEQVIEAPHDAAILNKLNSLISSVKFRPARLKGKRVDSYFILAFNQVNVLG